MDKKSKVISGLKYGAGFSWEERENELEKQLKDAEMEAIAYSTMIDLAEKEFNLSIRKKYNTKPSKK